ncbi:MAG: P1 family peptidase [Bacteroidota bacterium]
MNIPRSIAFLTLFAVSAHAQDRPRARDIGLEVGIFLPGPLNAITDVKGVLVGQVTLIKGDSVRTGATAILPHNRNMFADKVPAAMFVGNGFGKLVGSTQVGELGEIETPIVLTNTLNVWEAANGIVDFMLAIPENREVRSINPVVGETNDGYLNDIRGRHVTRGDVVKALQSATGGPVAEGAVGAGTGTICFGWKGGIGSSSRVLPASLGGFTIGVLVQTNYGGILDMGGIPVGKKLGTFSYRNHVQSESDGSCMIIIATDAPLSPRQLERLSKRAPLALGRTGSAMSHGSGDYVIAFSVTRTGSLDDDNLSPLFQAAVEATEEAIYNSLLKATDMTGHRGSAVKALPVDEVKRLLKDYGR